MAGAEKVLAKLKGGTTSFEVVLISTLKGGPTFPPFKSWAGGGGAQQVLPCLEGCGAETFGPAIYPFCSPCHIPKVSSSQK